MLDDKYMYGLAHELIFTWANKPDGNIDRDKLVRVVQDQLIAAQNNGYNEGRKDAALELQETIKKLVDEFE